jgi:DNA repair protein SbcC/Rad50
MSLRSKFPDIPSSGSTDPEFARSAALKAINQEISRCNREIEQDRNAAAEIKKIVDDIAGQRERVSALEAQISSAVRNSDALHQVLTALLPHIHGEHCPVCGRDYSEVSSQSLSAKLSTDILKLAGEARALEEAVNEKGRLEATISSLEGQAKALTIRLLKDEARSELLDRVSDLSEARSKLDGLAVEVRQAAEKLSTAARARTRLTEFSRREQRFTSIRQRLREIAQLIGVELNPSESPSNWIVDIERTLREQEVSLIQRQQSKELASDLLNKVLNVRAAVTREKQKLASAEAERDDLGNTLEVVRARRLLAKEVLEAAQRARVDVVRRVFNTSLNVIWRELFVRLAPYERFIPAFAVPDEQHLPLIAQLQTIERGGRPSGTPAIMLSAANLNVAALTLFLALNLAVEPKLDCVILDDPVQSMDEMHIAQFAALLRSLSREQQRQVIISVHEKPLFEYLRLELSPAYEGDKLITVELGQEQQDKTSAVCKTYDWSPERAVVSA